MQVLFFDRSAEVELLKAVTKKQIWIEGYTKNDGTFVPGHHATVNVSEDHDDRKVAAGLGTYSQKKAHKDLSKHPHFHGLHHQHQAALVLEHATAIQAAETSAAQVVKYKQKILAGKTPADNEIAAYLAAPEDKQKKVFHDLEAAGQKYVDISASAIIAYKSKLQVSPPAPEPVKEPEKVEAIHAADVKQGQSTDLGSGDAAGSGYIYSGPPDDENKSPESQAETVVAQAKLKEIADGHGGHYPTKAWQKLSASEEWPNIEPLEQLKMVVTLAKVWQADASKLSALHVWKKTLKEGGNPTAGQWATFAQLSDGERKEWISKLGDLDTPTWNKLNEAGFAADGIIIDKAKVDEWIKKGKKVTTTLAENVKEELKPEPKIILPTGRKSSEVKFTKDVLIKKLGVAVDELEAMNIADAYVASNGKSAKTFSELADALSLVGFSGTAAHYSDLAGKFSSSEGQPSVETPSSAHAWDVKTFTHSKKGHTVYSVQKPHKLSDDEYKAAAALAKQHGGFYSSYGKEGAIPGFHFKNEADANAFAAAIGWADQPSVSDPVSSAPAQAVPTEASPASASVPEDVSAEQPGPKEGDSKVENGVTYVLKDGRWHKIDEAPVVIQKKPKLSADEKAAALEAAIEAVDIPDFVGMDPHKNSAYYPGIAKKLKEAVLADGKSGFTKFITAYSDGSFATKTKAAGFKTGRCHENSPNLRRQLFWKFCADLKAALDANKSTSKPKAAPKSYSADSMPASAAPSLQSASFPGAVKMDGWEQTGKQQGSNPGGVFKDKSGQQWYCKFPADPDVVKNEFLAAKLYQMLGVSVPNLKLVEKDGKLGIASKWQDGLSKGTASQLAKAKGSHEAFAIDAWLGNWDVVGLANDNLMLDKDGKAVRVDVGGSLIYRAQGGKKGDAFGNEVKELKTLTDPSTNAKSAAVFAGVSKESMAWGAQQLAKLSPAQIKELCRKAGPGDRTEQDALAEKLIARRADLLKKLGIEDPWNKPPMDETKLPVNPADLPKPLDFANWNGPGKGLSSKAWLNDQNTKDDVALISFAAQGNLTALKNYQYDAVDKETGHVVGKKPITEHPSKHVKEHWAYLVELLDSIAHPSVHGLDMPPLGGGTVDEISDLSGFLNPGERVSTIPANKRLGFWMKLANAGTDVNDIVPKQKLHFTPAMRKESIEKWWPKVSQATKGYVSAVQSTGWVNHVWSEGNKTVDVSGYSGGVQGLAADVYKNAIESPEGTEIYRWMKMPKAMMDQLLSESVGLVFQNTDSMCTSYNPAWADNSHFGSDCLMKIRYAKGAKAIHSFASGAFKSENEITTLPGARFVLLSAKKGNPANGSGIEVEVLMLPPHEGFVSELQSQAALGKSILIFLKEAIHG